MFFTKTTFDIFHKTLDRATSVVRDYWLFETDLSSKNDAQKRIKAVFESASLIYTDHCDLNEDEATIAVMALNLASDGDQYISEEEALRALKAIENLKPLIRGHKNCSWNKFNDYCNVPPDSNWGGLLSSIKGVFYNSTQECNPNTIKAAWLLLSLYDYISKAPFYYPETPTDNNGTLFCHNIEQCYDGQLPEAKERFNLATAGLTEFYPEYWHY